MSSIRSKLALITLLPALLNGCAELPPNYAPVTTNSPEIAKDGPKHHLVKKGDTLYGISLLFDLDYRQLAQWNRIAPPYRLEVGQKIRLSDPSPDNKAGSVADDSKNDGTRVPKPLAETKQKIATAPATKKAGSQNKTAISLNRKTDSNHKPPSDTKPIRNSIEKSGSDPQKKSTISIDNENMLMLNFQWPIKGKILKSFSRADSKGIDIAGEMGQDVSAAEAGKVVYSGQGLIGYGNLLIIKHNDLYLSAYANNSRLLVAEGHQVEKGELIAKVGQAGSNKASLHFEIRKNGKPVNPLSLLPGK
ncbi:MAG: peptidoglycan DD-metalloendopeptidase family protein [Methylobacter tundripaludum]|nr:peptidoglycan DD-metalloendopeptidase family protein [Methylobacter tundripaludum]